MFLNLTAGAVGYNHILHHHHVDVVVLWKGRADQAGALVEEDHLHWVVVTRRATGLTHLNTRLLVKVELLDNKYWTFHVTNMKMLV